MEGVTWTGRAGEEVDILGVVVVVLLKDEDMGGDMGWMLLIFRICRYLMKVHVIDWCGETQ